MPTNTLTGLCSSGRLFSVVLAAALAAPLGASAVLLSDGNSTMNIGAGGITDWTVEGQDQVNLDGFFYRVNNTGPIQSISTLGAPVNQATANSLLSTYTTSDFVIQVSYSLLGGSIGSGNSTLSIAMSIQNVGAQPLSIQFYEYGEYTPGGSVNNMVGMDKNISGTLFNGAEVSGNGVLVQTAVTPGAQQGEAALYSSTLSQFAAGNSLNGNLSAGPGLATWAFGWDRTIVAGGSALFSTVTTIQGVTRVPETTGFSVIFIALATCGLFGMFVKRSERQPALAKITR